MNNQNLTIACPKGRLEGKVVKYLSERGVIIEQPFFNAVSYTHLTLPTNREV